MPTGNPDLGRNLIEDRLEAEELGVGPKGCALLCIGIFITDHFRTTQALLIFVVVGYCPSCHIGIVHEVGFRFNL